MIFTKTCGFQVKVYKCILSSCNRCLNGFGERKGYFYNAVVSVVVDVNMSFIRDPLFADNS